MDSGFVVRFHLVLAYAYPHAWSLNMEITMSVHVEVLHSIIMIIPKECNLKYTVETCIERQF